MHINHKKSNTYQTVLWIAFFVLLGLVLLFVMNKAGVFSNQTFAAIKEKIFPFG